MRIAFLDDDTIGKDVSLDPLRKLGELVLYGRTKDDEVDANIAGFDVVITNKVQIRKKNIDAAKSLKLICVSATGVNMIDVDYALSKGIPVRNVAGYSTESVAMITMMHILNLVGHGMYFNDYVHSGKYSANGLANDVSHPFSELFGQNLGIVAMGNIGHRVASLASAFGMKISYFSTSGTSHCTEYPSLPIDELLSQSDSVSIHAPLNERTNNLITYEKMKLMKKTAYLVNVGRGAIINETDLVDALNDGLIAGAAVDVYVQEPIPAEHPYLSQLKDPFKLIFSPHIAWTSIEARTLLIDEIAKNIAAGY